MSADRFPHAEGELVSSLGLARKRVREVRSSALVRGDDWSHTGGQVRYSEGGLKKLLSALRIPPSGEPIAPPPAPAAAETPPAPEDLAPKKIEKVPAAQIPPRAAPAPGPLKRGDVHELVMVRTYQNRQIVLAEFGDVPARVRVRDSAKLIRGMKMKCAFLERDLWRLAQPLPRWRGKW